MQPEAFQDASPDARRSIRGLIGKSGILWTNPIAWTPCRVIDEVMLPVPGDYFSLDLCLEV
jgi:hypothetical protein